MAKTTGGVRNYRRTSFAYQKRRQEYLMLLAGGDYNADKSKFYSSGGFVVTHNEHNSDNRGKNGKIVDKSQSTAKALARKGYRVFLDSEKSISFGDSKRDG